MSPNYLEQLKTFIAETDPVFSKTLPVSFTCKLDSTGEPLTKFSLDHETVSIFIVALSEPEQEGLKKVLVLLQDQGLPFIHDERDKIITQFRASDAPERIKSQDGFFESLPDVEDRECFKVGIFLKIVFDSKYTTFLDREGFHDEKSRIEMRYGARGSKILKICVADYYSLYILPLFSMYNAGKISRDKYLADYNLIVNEQAFAIFVSEHMTEKDLETAITKKIDGNKLHNKLLINIHGIGKSNVDLIKKVLPTINFSEHGYDESTNSADSIYIGRYRRKTQ